MRRRFFNKVAEEKPVYVYKYTTTDGQMLELEGVQNHKYENGVGSFESYSTSCVRFKGQYSLETLSMPEGLLLIARETFYGCSNLNSINIPSSVSSIGDYAFNECTSLTDLYIQQGETQLRLGYNMDGIAGMNSGRGLFYDCPLETLYLGRDLLYDTDYLKGYSPFCFNETLTYITISNNVTNIGEAAFFGCYGLTSIVIPNSVTSIGNYAFNGCTALTSIVIPNSVTSIGGAAFYNCSNLKTVYNYSSLNLTKGSTDYGYVAYYADEVINMQ